MGKSASVPVYKIDGLEQSLSTKLIGQAQAETIGKL